jgi:hypothetical protein
MKNIVKATLGMSALIAVVGMPNVVKADRWDRHDRDRHEVVRVEVGATPVVVDHAGQVWVEPAYQTVSEKVWVEPVVEKRVDRVWMPEQRGLRDRYVGHGHFVKESVVVVPGHFEDRASDVVMTPGHFEDVNKQVLVAEGHWETRVDQVAVVAPVPVHEGFRLQFHW